MLLVIIVPTGASADIGPKPSVVIDFEGLSGEQYYVTLMSSVKSTGPYSVLDESQDYLRRSSPGDKGYDIYLKFVEYTDKDGYYFLQFFQNCSDNHQFSWGYYPPQNFKILLYFPESGSFSVSPVYERYAFDSYYTVDATGLVNGGEITAQVITAKKSYDFTNEIISLLVRIVLTIALELLIAFLFVFRSKRQLLFIIFVNAATQIALNVALNLINYKLGAMAFAIFYVLLELLVFVIETVLFSTLLGKFSDSRVSKRRAVTYAFVANLASFAAGFGLAYVIPGVF